MGEKKQKAKMGPGQGEGKGAGACRRCSLGIVGGETMECKAVHESEIEGKWFLHKRLIRDLRPRRLVAN